MTDTETLNKYNAEQWGSNAGKHAGQQAAEEEDESEVRPEWEQGFREAFSDEAGRAPTDCEVELAWQQEQQVAEEEE